MEQEYHPPMDGLWAFADQYDFLVAYPQGLDIALPRYLDYPGWNVDGSLGDWDDAAFVRALVQDIPLPLNTATGVEDEPGSMLPRLPELHQNYRIHSSG